MAKREQLFAYKPIGVVRSPYREPEGTPIQGAFTPESEGSIKIFPEYAEGLDDLEGFSHIWIIYHFHLCEGYKLKVIPFMDDVERGLFSCRAPRRPNPIGLSLVRLVKREGPLLHIAEIDMVDGTPVLDIKPFFEDIDCREDTRTGWLNRVDEQMIRERGRADKRFTE